MKRRHRDRLGDIGLAAALADALLVALHGKGGDGDDRDRVQVVVLLQPLGHFQAGNLRQLDVHEDQVGPMHARQIERLEPLRVRHGLVAARLDEVAEELHVELVVLDDHDFFRHRSFRSSRWVDQPASPQVSRRDTKPIRDDTAR